MKQTIAKYLLFLTLTLVAVSYLPWIYLTKVYYMLRYAIMGSMALTVILTFSVEKYFSARFMRLFALTILVLLAEFVIFHFTGHRFRPSDLSQLVIAFLCAGIGISLDCDLKTWADICYFYTLGLIVMGVINCFYWAGDLYIPEYYMFNEGKNQVGGMLAIAGIACLFFGIKLKEQRTHFLVLFILVMMVLLLIRARADFFALLACATFITVKDSDWRIEPKTVITLLCLGLIGYILYTAFLSEELHTFVLGGKTSQDIDVVTSNRWARDKQGLDYIFNDSVVGEQESSSGILLIHNYILLRFVRYGIWSFALVGFYLYFGVTTVVALLRSRKTDLRDVGYVACALPLIVSLVEPNFPYGPGSVQMLAFLLLGVTLQSRQRCEPHSILADDGQPHRVLHICNDFPNSTVHSELYRQLDKDEVDQVVYSPIRDSKLEGRNGFEGRHTRIVYSNILKPLHRLFFNRKVDVVVRDLAKRVDLTHISCTHATNLFSDGAVALRLKQRYGIPYIVAVRNSDVNAFLRFMPHLWWVHRAVIREAERVIFITPALHRRLNGHWTLCGMKHLLREKSQIIPNGVNHYWIDHLQTAPSPSASDRLLYVGLFDDNKNVLRLMQAVLQLRQQLPGVRLDLVGGGGNREKEVLDLVRQHPDIFRYLGKVYNKERLQRIYAENSVFVMPSLHETFGLVYVEALSQGLALLYTKGEGIDGLFEEPVGEAVAPTRVAEIAAALHRLTTGREHYRLPAPETFARFDWEKIAEQYKFIYDTVSLC